MKTFELHWRRGDIQKVQGYTIKEAFSSAGYGAGALSALDFYKEEEKPAVSPLDSFHGATPEYIWDKRITLSPNAVEFLLYLVTSYHPEPWEAGMREEILKRLEAIEMRKELQK